MQIQCPQCTEVVPAEHINIQEMVAVCPNCHAVFEFRPAASEDAAKLKRRKVKKPSRIELDEQANALEMAFRTNFRPDKDENLQVSVTFSIIFTIFTFIFSGAYLAGEMPIFMPAMFLLFALIAIYSLATIMYNKTHIRMDDAEIEVSRKPLWSVRPIHTVSVGNLERIDYEETPASVEHSYDTPRYTVYGERFDGKRRTIITDLIEDYAIYIAQELNQQLQYDDDALDTSRLTHDDDYSDDELHIIQQEARQQQRL